MAIFNIDTSFHSPSFSGMFCVESIVFVPMECRVFRPPRQLGVRHTAVKSGGAPPEADATMSLCLQLDL